MTRSDSAARVSRRFWAGIVWAAIALILVFFLLVAAVWAMLPRLYPEVRLAGAPPLEVARSTFRVRQGRGVFYGQDVTQIRALQGGKAVLASRASFRAEQAPVLRLALSGGHPDLRTVLVWRTSEAPDKVRSVVLHRGNEAVSWHRLAGREDWTGQVVEIGVVLSGLYAMTRAVEPIRFHSMAFYSGSRGVLARLLWHDWRAFAPWRVGQTNYYRGFAEGAPLSPVVMAGAWVVGALAMFVVAARVKRWPVVSLLPAALLVVVVPWLALDGLWRSRLADQLEATWMRFGGLVQSEKRKMEDDAQLQRSAQAVLDMLAPVRGKRLFLLKDSVRHNYHRLRLQYHLLPLNVYNFDSMLPDPAKVRRGDYLLLLDDPEAVRFDAGRDMLVDSQVSLPAQRLLTARRIELYRLEGLER